MQHVGSEMKVGDFLPRIHFMLKVLLSSRRIAFGKELEFLLVLDREPSTEIR